MSAQINAAELRFMELAERGTKDGHDCVFTCRRNSKGTGEGLVVRRLMQHVTAVVCDGDGFALEPEREREGYALTPEGRDALREARVMDAEEARQLSDMGIADTWNGRTLAEQAAGEP